MTPRSWRLLAVGIVATLALAGWDISRGDFPLFPVLYLIAMGVSLLRPLTVVDASGVRRPLRLRRFVPWSEVAAVAAPEPGALRVRLMLDGGRAITLDDIPAQQSAAVAELGGRELRRLTPVSIPAPRTIAAERERTDQERAADVDRRARALAAQRAEMAAQAHLRPRGIPRRETPSS